MSSVNGVYLNQEGKVEKMAESERPFSSGSIALVSTIEVGESSCKHLRSGHQWALFEHLDLESARERASLGL